MVRAWWNRNRVKVMAPDGAPGGEPSQQDMINDLFDFVEEKQEGEAAAEPASLDSEFEPNLGGEQEGDDGGGEAGAEPAGAEPAQQQQQEPEGPTVEETLRSQLVAMAAELEKLRTGSNVHQIYPPQGQAPEQPPATQQTATQVADQQQTQAVQAQQTVQQYLTAEELDQVIDKPELILTAIQRAQADIVQQFSQNLPIIVSNMVNQQVAIQSAVTEFYSSNEDLRPHADYVKFVMRELEGKNQDKPYAELFQLTADESRKRLGLQNPAQQTPNRGQSRQQKPAFAGTRKAGTHRPAPKQEGSFFETNVADMFQQ